MKRFVWVVLLAFCTALAQVQPVQAVAKAQEDCGCCEPAANACGMPDCAPVPCSPSGATLAAAPTIAVRAEADSVLPKSRSFRNHFYAQFAPRPAQPAEFAPRVAAPVASVPAFKAHCSFLI
jgi:hypothetical protein